jgi:hypothetical protein
MESDGSFIFLISHVFIAKPVSTFAKHALGVADSNFVEDLTSRINQVRFFPGPFLVHPDLRQDATGARWPNLKALTAKSSQNDNRWRDIT